MSLQNLTQLLARIPGLGPRSARRALIHLLGHREHLMKPLSANLQTVLETIQNCNLCGNYDTQSPCHICQDPKRDRSVLCVVEDVADLWALERTPSFRGGFHVLGGTLSAIHGIGPQDLRIPQLVTRLQDGEVQEVILALSATVEGQTTAHYVADRLASFSIKVTALAHGIPVGGELDYMDEGTLTTALQSRRHF